MALEYTHRFASSGTENLPVSFNYFEPFCEGKLISKSTAPYIDLLPETNHLFSCSDFFDFITSSDSDNFAISSLLSLPEAEIFHFTANGNILELSLALIKPESTKFFSRPRSRDAMQKREREEEYAKLLRSPIFLPQKK